MTKYILKRLGQLILVLLGVTFLTFMVTQAAPSDAAEMKYISMGMMQVLANGTVRQMAGECT